TPHSGGSIQVALILLVRLHHGVDGLEDALQRGPEELRHRVTAANSQAQNQATVSLLIAVEPEAEPAELEAEPHGPLLVLVEVDADVRLDDVGGRLLLFLAAGEVRVGLLESLPDQVSR